MEQSALLNVIVMAAILGSFRNVIGSPDPREIQRRPIQGTVPASLRARGGIPKGPLAAVASSSSSSSSSTTKILATNPTDLPSTKSISESKLNSKMFLKAPSNWFLPNLKKWPNLQIDLRQNQIPFAFENSNENAFVDATEFISGNEHRPVSRSAPAPNNLRYSLRTLDDEWHPRYTPVREHQRLLRILG